MVKYIPDIYVGTIDGEYGADLYVDPCAARDQFISDYVGSEVNFSCSRLTLYLNSILQDAGLNTLVKVYPKFSYYSLWGSPWDDDDPEETASFTLGNNPKPSSEEGLQQRWYKLHTGLKLSAAIAYSDAVVVNSNFPDFISDAVLTALECAFEGVETEYITYIENGSNRERLMEAAAAAEPDELGCTLYRIRPYEALHGPVPVVQVLSDAKCCVRVLSPHGITGTECVSYSDRHGDYTDWIGVGACTDPFIANGDGTAEPKNEEFMLAQNLLQQNKVLNDGPYNSSLRNYNNAVSQWHGPKLQNLKNRLEKSMEFDGTVPGVVALRLNGGFADGNDLNNFIYADSENECPLRIIGREDLDNLNYTVFALQTVLKSRQLRPYYCLQRPISLSDLNKLLIASVGNVLVICGDYGDGEYRRFLCDNSVKAMLIQFRYMVQYVFLYDRRTEVTDGNYEQLAKAFNAGETVPVRFLFESMVIPEKEVTWLDFSKLDIKFSEESKQYLYENLIAHSGDSELVTEFIKRYDKKQENLAQVIKDFRTFRSERFDAELQHRLNAVRKELGDLKGESDQEKHNRLFNEINDLTAALKGTALAESKYTAAKDWDAELENLHGLTKAKEHIRDLKKIIAARYSRGADDVAAKNVFTFEGNPGCGKTMAARYFAYSLKQNGFLSADEPFRDISISELVGTYVGQAADKTDKIFETCAGSVIFIDEAYGLLDQNDFGRSAINAIVKNISSMSSDTVLILAGYPTDISRLLKENRGLESRVAKRIQFDDYSCGELLDILRDNLGKNCGLYYKLSEISEIEDTIKKFLLKASSCGEHNTGRTLGNARFIDNLISKLEIAHASTLTDEELKERIDPSQFPIDMGNVNTKEDEPNMQDGKPPHGIQDLSDRVGQDNENAKAADGVSADAAEEDEEQKRSELVNKRRTITLDIVNSAIADLNTELEKTGSAIGSTRPTYYVPTSGKDTFERVIGNENAKKLLMQQLDIFKNPHKYQYAPEGTRGILLTGDPGCGKTMLARAMAHEAGNDVAFMSANGTDFIKSYSGQGAEAIGALFDEIETYEKCILFIDEIDAIGGSRGGGSSGGTLENQGLMKLLTCLDGFKKRKNFLVIAATNVPESLDSALKRRLGVQVSVELPNAEERLKLLELCLEERNSKGSIPRKKLKFLADYATAGFSGDRITKCVNEAYYRSAANEKPIQLKTLEDVIYGMTYGFNGNIEVNEKEERNTAYHEAGHAMIRHSFKENIFKATILPNDDGALGYVLSAPMEAGSYTWTREKLEHQICVSLGGRAAEEIFSEDHTASSGCSSDLMHATGLAVDMVAKWGMGSTLRVRKPDDPEVLREADEIIKQCYERTKEILNNNADKVRTFAEMLLKKKTLLKDDLDAILGKLTMEE